MNSRSVGIMIAGGIFIGMFLYMAGYLLESLYPSVDRTFRVTEFSTPVSDGDANIHARGLVFRGPESPVVLCLVELAELRGAEHARWCQALAEVADTGRERVMLVCTGRPDRPIADPGARDLLAATPEVQAHFLSEQESYQTLSRLTHSIRTALEDPSDESETPKPSADWRAWLEKNIDIASAFRGLKNPTSELIDSFRFRSTTLVVKPQRELSVQEWQSQLASESASSTERLQAALELSLQSHAGALTNLACLDLGDTLVLSLPGCSADINRGIADRIRPDVDLCVLENRNGWPGSMNTPYSLDDANYVAPMRDGLWRICQGTPPRQSAEPLTLTLPETNSCFALGPHRGRSWRLGYLTDKELVIQDVEKMNRFPVPDLLSLKQSQISLGPGRADRETILTMTGQKDSDGFFEILAMDPSSGVTERLTDKRPGHCRVLPGSILETTLGRTLIPAVWSNSDQSSGKLDIYFTDNGIAWSRMERAEDVDEPNLKGMAFLERRNGSLYLVGEMADQTLVEAVSLDRGETWGEYSSLSSQINGQLAALHRIVSLGDWILVTRKDKKINLFLSRSEGASWTPFATPPEWAGLREFQLWSAGATITGAGIDSNGALRVIPLRIDRVKSEQKASRVMDD